jgi:hypothetical protein
MLLVVTTVAAAQAPRTATLRSPLSLQDALEQLQRQTGNAVGDLRATKTNPTLQLAHTQGTFWPLLDEIGKASGAGFTLYGPDGGVALIDTPYRAVPTSYSGLFRVSVKRVLASLDLETKSHHVQTSLDVAWERALQPFYLEVASLEVTDAKGKQRVDARGQISVAGRSATELDLRLPAPPRSTPRLAMLEGRLAVIGPSRMLDFTFDKLAPLGADDKPRRLTQDGVSVSLTRLSVGRERWRVDVLIENPPGGPSFDTFQSWLDNNRIALVREEGGKKEVWTPGPSDEQQLGDPSPRRAHVSYYFPIERTSRAGLPADWVLHYRTPGRIVQLDVPFEFRDIPLP